MRTLRVRKIDVGSCVRTRITQPEKFVTGAASALDGKLGTVEREKVDGEWLVHFDVPAGTWRAHQRPPVRFWFSLWDLELLPEDA